MKAFLLRIALLTALSLTLISARQGCTAGGAPAPLPRRATVGLRPGAYLLSWSGVIWTATLSDDGGWRAERDGCVFVGSWCADPSGRKLWFRERTRSGGSWTTYEVTFDARLAGRTREGVEVRLERMR